MTRKLKAHRLSLFTVLHIALELEGELP